MPEGLTQTKTPTFSETRPEIDRNAGRLHFGMVAGFTSENPAGINRNPQLECLTPRSSRRSARPSPALDQMVTAVDAMRPTARPAPSRGSGFVLWHFSDLTGLADDA